MNFLQFLERHELLAEVADFLQAEIEARLRLEVVPEFWKFFDQPDDDQIRVSEKANLFCEVCSLNSIILFWSNLDPCRNTKNIFRLFQIYTRMFQNFNLLWQDSTFWRRAFQSLPTPQNTDWQTLLRFSKFLWREPCTLSFQLLLRDQPRHFTLVLCTYFMQKRSLLKEHVSNFTN